MMNLRTLSSIGIVVLALSACGDDSDSGTGSECDKQACMDCIDTASADPGPGTSTPICEAECDSCATDEAEPTKDGSSCADSEGSGTCPPAQ